MGGGCRGVPRGAEPGVIVLRAARLLRLREPGSKAHNEGSGEAQGFDGATHTITQTVAGMHIPSCVPLPLTYASLCVLFEHQATPFVLGNSPKYDFATTYKVTEHHTHAWNLSSLEHKPLPFLYLVSPFSVSPSCIDPFIPIALCV